MARQIPFPMKDCQATKAEIVAFEFLYAFDPARLQAELRKRLAARGLAGGDNVDVEPSGYSAGVSSGRTYRVIYPVYTGYRAPVTAEAILEILHEIEIEIDRQLKARHVLDLLAQEDRVG